MIEARSSLPRNLGTSEAATMDPTSSTKPWTPTCCVTSSSSAVPAPHGAPGPSAFSWAAAPAAQSIAWRVRPRVPRGPAGWGPSGACGTVHPPHWRCKRPDTGFDRTGVNTGSIDSTRQAFCGQTRWVGGQRGCAHRRWAPVRAPERRGAPGRHQREPSGACRPRHRFCAPHAPATCKPVRWTDCGVATGPELWLTKSDQPCSPTRPRHHSATPRLGQARTQT